MFVDIDIQRCVGCGLCEENHPEIFTVGARFAIVTQPIVPEDLIDSVKQTASDCPADAIIIEEAVARTE